MKKWSHIIATACGSLAACVVVGLAIYAIQEHRTWQRRSSLVDKYPISAYELSSPLDIEIPAVYDWRQTGDIELLPVRPEKIGPQHFRNPAIETKNYWEPGGWIANDAPIIKGESVHPKGVRTASSGERDPDDGYRLRPEFKPYTSTEGVGRVTSAIDTRRDRE